MHAARSLRPPLSWSLLPGLLAAAGLGLWSTDAHAEKKGRVHADSEVFGFNHTNPDGDADPVNSVGFGIGRPAGSDAQLEIGDLRPMFGLGGAFGFAQERAWVGAKASIIFQATDVGNDDGPRNYVGGQFVPYFHWIFLPGKPVRPYLEARFGLGGGLNSTEFDDGMDSVRVRNHVIYPLVGASGGVHFFLIDAVSFDLGLGFDYAAPHRRRTSDSSTVEDDTDYDKLADIINLNVLLGISIWLP